MDVDFGFGDFIGQKKQVCAFKDRVSTKDTIVLCALRSKMY